MAGRKGPRSITLNISNNPLSDFRQGSRVASLESHSQTSSATRNSFPSTRSPTLAQRVKDVMEPREVVSPKKSVYFNHPTIRPIFPECIGRYDRNVFIPWEDTNYIISPLNVTFQMHETPLGWMPHHHPEGARYFYHEQKRVYTEANIYDDALRARIHSNLDEIEDFLQAHNIQRPPRDDLVLELAKSDDGKIKTSYYFANHKNRVIYFLDRYDACNLPVWSEVQGVTSPSHIKHEIEAQYWYIQLLGYHCLLFPQALDLSHEMVVELRDIVTFYISDLILTPTSTAPYKVEDMQKILSLVDSLTLNVGTEFKGSTCTLSSFMYTFVRQRFLNFHGQPGARLNRDQSVHGKPTSERSWIILILSPILFYAPEVYLGVLERLGIDGLLHDAVWVQFINRLKTEWQELTLYATVLLNANVAFLAIQSVDIHQGEYRSLAQIFSYMSTMSSIGSIILGLLLVRQNRNKAGNDTYGHFVFLGEQDIFLRRLEGVSVLFSLPHALLMWGTLHFLAAFLSMCFQNSNVWAQSFVSTILVLIAILVVWCIWMARELTPHEADPKSEAIRPFKKLWCRWLRLIFRRAPCTTGVTDV